MSNSSEQAQNSSKQAGSEQDGQMCQLLYIASGKATAAIPTKHCMNLLQMELASSRMLLECIKQMSLLSIYVPISFDP